MKKEPHNPLARYAFGYSDQKPGWGFWAVHVVMVVVAAAKLWYEL